MTNISKNQLVNEPSAYLRQHANNPVYWQPWGKTALNASKSLQRPILLSIGYAACHWCHVMAHESFEDPQTAEMMNKLFINIKVDREERPDIDQIYMAALGAMGQQGGWPLTMFLQPDGKPFWGGTYFPRYAQHNLPSFTDVLHAVSDLWLRDKEKINHNSGAVYNHIEARLSAQNPAMQNDTQRFTILAERIYKLFDPVLGGVNGAPKFPNAPFMDTLWLSWLYNHNENHRDIFLLSIRSMLQGGIYDHLGGGLSRYSTDNQWLVPHFEKMLYDNAQMIRHANYAFAQTGDDLFRVRIEETIEWLIREMQLTDGSFASSLDADSEGEEGKFYVWSEDEINLILGAEAKSFNAYYGITHEGNWEGKNIPNRLHAINETIVSDEAILSAKQKLFEKREKRSHPARDEKALTDWNALTIRALAEAGRSFERKDWLDYAIQAYRSTKATFQNGRIAHCKMDDVIVYPALSTDYAAMINAALTLYASTAEETYLKDASAYKLALDAAHRDGSGNYRLSALGADDVIIHSYGDYDEAIASGTSQIIEAFTRLFSTTGDMNIFKQLENIVEQALGRAFKQQYGQIGILNSARIAAEPLSLVIIAENYTDELVSMANRYPDPRRTDTITIGAFNQNIELPIGGTVQAHKTTAWLCKGHICLPSVSSAQSLESLLKQAE